MKKIDFFIAGAQKSGTTALHMLLKNSSELVLPSIKECKVFSDDKMYAAELDKISDYFDSSESYMTAQMRGISDVQILRNSKKCAKRIFEYNPKAKILVSLRNPYERIVSSYFFNVKNQVEHREFHEAIKVDEEYIEHSSYYTHVSELVRIFGRENVLILEFKELLKGKVNKELEDFLELPENTIITKVEHHNPGGGAKFSVINKLFFRKSKLKNVYTSTIPLKLRMSFRKKIINPLISWNTKHVNIKEQKELYLEICKKHFGEKLAEDISKLSELTGVDFNRQWS